MPPLLWKDRGYRQRPVGTVFKRKVSVKRAAVQTPVPDAYCSGLGAVHAAVWDDLGKRDNPVVDLVSSPPLH